MSACSEKGMENKKRILITFRKGGENGGPYVSHKRIMESCLKEEFEFIPWMLDVPKKMLRPASLRKNIRFIHEVNPDIIHFTGLQLEGFAAMLTIKLSKCKNTVCAVHGSSLDAMGFAKWKKRILEGLENWTIKNSTRYYGVSKFVSEWKRLQGYPGASGFVYNLPDFQTAMKCRSRVRQEWNIPEDAIVVVSTGRITVDKGYDVLSKAILAGKEHWEKVLFLIVGDGAYLPEMKKQMKDNGLQDKVIFTGYRKDIPDILEASDLFVLCTLHETLCNSVLEASYHRLPVISTNTGGIPEIVQSGVSGYLLQPGDANAVLLRLVELVGDENLRGRMGQAGMNIVCKKFSEEAITSAIRNIYRSFL